LAGGSIGLLAKGKIPEDFSKGIFRAMGLCVIVIGVAGALTIVAGEVTGNLILIMAAVTLGALAGTLARFDAGINRFGAFLQKKLTKNEENNGFAEGFVTASLLFCVGAMSIIGPIESGMSGELPKLLIIKSILDGVTALFFASRFGIGVLFAAAPVLIYQGAIELTASLIPVSVDVTTDVIAQVSAVGSVLILAIGLNMTLDAKIKTANLLPALLFAVGFYYLFSLFGMV